MPAVPDVLTGVNVSFDWLFPKPETRLDVLEFSLKRVLGCAIARRARLDMMLLDKVHRL